MPKEEIESGWGSLEEERALKEVFPAPKKPTLFEDKMMDAVQSQFWKQRLADLNVTVVPAPGGYILINGQGIAFMPSKA